MTDPFNINAGSWWRHDRYEIWEGHIRPARKARLIRYDPWEDYLGARTGRKEASPPYQSLLSLTNDISILPAGDERRSYLLAPEAQEKVLEWCAQHGLLGVLLQRVRSVVLAPRWQPLRFAELEETESSLFGERDSSDILVPTVRRFSRFSLGWKSMKSFKMAKGKLLVVQDEPEQQGALVSNEDHPEEWAHTGAYVEALADFAVDFEPLGKTWARFFPDVPQDETETFEYPIPTSKEFWAQYAEPIDEFINGAAALRSALKSLQAMKEGFSRKEALRGWRGMIKLNALAAPASATLYPNDDGIFQQRWVSPSLLASYAMMVMQDYAEDRSVLQCEVCQKLFMSGSYQVKYCSSTCRHTAQKRRYRQRKRDSKGQS